MCDGRVNVANAASRKIIARVAENKISVEGGKVYSESSLFKCGFSSIGQKKSMEFVVSTSQTKPIYVTIFEMDDTKTTRLICHDYVLARDRSILYTSSGIHLSKKDDPFSPIISQSQAAMLANTDPRRAAGTRHECGVDYNTGEAVCWAVRPKQRK